MAQRLTGTVIIKSDGVSIRSKGGATLSFGGQERTPQYADGRLQGFTEQPMAATVTATIAHGADTDVDALINTKDASLIFECDSGVSYLVRGAFLTTPPELTAGEGDLAVEFTGQPAEAL